MPPSAGGRWTPSRNRGTDTNQRAGHVTAQMVGTGRNVEHDHAFARAGVGHRAWMSTVTGGSGGRLGRHGPLLAGQILRRRVEHVDLPVHLREPRCRHVGAHARRVPQHHARAAHGRHDVCFLHQLTTGNTAKALRVRRPRRSSDPRTSNRRSCGHGRSGRRAILRRTPAHAGAIGHGHGADRAAGRRGLVTATVPGRAGRARASAHRASIRSCRCCRAATGSAPPRSPATAPR